MNDYRKEFTASLKDADIPTTEEETRQRWVTLVSESDLNISNNSEFSPFWRFVTLAVTRPVNWLVNFIIDYVLPQSFVKFATGSILELHADAVDIEKKLATKALGNITFTRESSDGDIAIPKNTVIQTTAINGVIYRLLTTTENTLIDGELSTVVEAEAELAGESYNLAQDYYTILEKPISGIDSVNNASDWLISPGSDDESDEALRQRIRNQFTAVNRWHTDAAYTALITQFAAVGTLNVFFEHDAPRGPGTANAFILLNIGNPSPAFLSQIQASIMEDGNHGHGDDLQVFPMPETFYDLSVEVWLKVDNTLSETEVEQDLRQFIGAAFRENLSYSPTLTQPNSRFSFSTLSEEIHSQFSSIASLQYNRSDILTDMEIARLNSLEIIIND